MIRSILLLNFRRKITQRIDKNNNSPEAAGVTVLEVSNVFVGVVFDVLKPDK